MKKIRKSTFETNSSSTHSICVAHEDVINFPEKVKFNIGNFGWEVNTVLDTASYLYTGLLDNSRLDDIDKLKHWLDESGIKYSFQKPEFGYFGDTEEYPYLKNGAIDHADELNDFLDAVMSNKHHCFEFLFAKGSYVKTGNDNDEYDRVIDIKPDYTHTIYYKGN